MAVAPFLLAGCTVNEFEITDKSVTPGSEITWVGKPTKLSGSGELAIGKRLPILELVNSKMETVKLENNGKVKIITSIPSIDTPVCDFQAHKLGETTELKPEVEKILVSMDLPYAQRRFVEQTKLKGLSFYSDYRGLNFAKASGLQIDRNGLLARAVIVVDKEGVVRHLQIVPEITQMPNMEAAFKKANELVGG